MPKAQKEFPINPTEAQFAYAAGLVDGEGCIVLTKGRSTYSYRSGKENYYYILRVQVANTDPRMIQWCQEVFGGGVSPDTSQRSGRKVCWRWVIYGQMAVKFLTAIYPYMVIKREQVEVALEYKAGTSGVVVDKKEIANRDDIRNRLTLLKRGVA